MVRSYRESTRVMGALVCLLGLVMIATALAGGGGPLARGVILGAVFALLGAGRLIIAARARRPPPDAA